MTLPEVVIVVETMFVESALEKKRTKSNQMAKLPISNSSTPTIGKEIDNTVILSNGIFWSAKSSK